MNASRESPAWSARGTGVRPRARPAAHQPAGGPLRLLRLLRLLRPPGPEAVPVDLRAGTKHPPEVLAQIAGRAESAAVCDSLDGQVTRLQQSLREMDPFPHDPLIGRGMGSAIAQLDPAASVAEPAVALGQFGRRSKT
jgi:hypothetical protein